MNGIRLSGQSFLRRSASRIFLGSVLLFGSPWLFSAHLYATSVVALIDRANHRLVIATDCRVSRDSRPFSACKIIQEPGCTVAMAGLYEDGNSDFHLREYVHMACREPGDLRSKADAFLRIARRPFEEAVTGIRKGDPAYFTNMIAKKPTEVIFAGIQDGAPGLIVRAWRQIPRGRSGSSGSRVRVPHTSGLATL